MIAADRKRRERVAVDARQAIQYARLFSDPPHHDPLKAKRWAMEAAALADEFEQLVVAELACEARTKGEAGYCGTCEATGTLSDEETECPCCEGSGVH